MTQKKSKLERAAIAFSKLSAAKQKEILEKMQGSSPSKKTP